MIRIRRWQVALFGLLFGLYPIYLAFTSLADYENVVVVYVSMLLYFFAIVPSVSFYKSVELPRYQTIYNLFVALLVPQLVLSTIDATFVGTYATWFVGGIACVAAATAFRGHSVIASAYVASVSVQVIFWGGLKAISTTGIFGAIVFLLAGTLMSRGIRLTYAATNEYQEKTVKALSGMAASTAARDEHKKRIASALSQALPQLREISSITKPLNEAKRHEAIRLENSLRDEIRGRGLMSPDIRVAIRNARDRGLEVVVLDEGGLDALGAAERTEILKKAAAAIDGVQQGRVTLRAPQGEQWNVTLVATRAGVAQPDLWLKF